MDDRDGWRERDMIMMIDIIRCTFDIWSILSLSRIIIIIYIYIYIYICATHTHMRTHTRAHTHMHIGTQLLF